MTFEAEIVLFSFPECYEYILSVLAVSFDAFFTTNQSTNCLLVVTVAVLSEVVVAAVITEDSTSLTPKEI